MKIKKFLKSLLFEIEAIRIISEKNIYKTHESDESFELGDLPEKYMNFQVKKFYIESYELDNKKHFILNVKI